MALTRCRFAVLVNCSAHPSRIFSDELSYRDQRGCISRPVSCAPTSVARSAVTPWSRMSHGLCSLATALHCNPPSFLSTTCCGVEPGELPSRQQRDGRAERQQEPGIIGEEIAERVVMSALGHKRKSSNRAHHVRFTPESGHRATRVACLLCARGCREQMQQHACRILDATPRAARSYSRIAT